MSDEFDQRTKDALDGPPSDAGLIEKLRAVDAARVADAGPIYPDIGDMPLTAIEASDLAGRFRSLRDEQRGTVVAPRSMLPGEPGRVAAALMSDATARQHGLTGKPLRADQREVAEAMVDLQSFRPDDEATLILAGAKTADAIDAAERLMTARAAVIAWIRDDPSVVGNRNALRDLELRIGDGRRALDAVNGYREKQAFGFLAMFGVGALVIIAIVILVVIQASS
jgi:hypothetical protein